MRAIAISSDLRRRASRIAEAATEAANPELSIRRLLRIEDGFLVAGDYRYDLGQFSAVRVVGAGKASARMAVAVENILGLRIRWCFRWWIHYRRGSVSGHSCSPLRIDYFELSIYFCEKISLPTPTKLSFVDSR